MDRTARILGSATTPMQRRDLTIEAMSHQVVAQALADAGLTADQVDGWDSFAHLRVLMTVERAFGVKFSAGEVDGLKNVGDLANLIAARTAA